ncbi:preprotein translocase subunit SecF [Hypnocyclicus thermotrophus]|uniref:Protein-export membrane protein SecF n=1 Tax=Hypnocyclicus thermotrophus TaxID=1627895 RepID=A0AA46I5E5_9FUSO|nr:protein translocase subunit SecF [Hypnocyclicus thermotrophus]TDT69214.1 preprotein translocase subunit SecF [Hypnocyclicus thermotrophus]
MKRLEIINKTKIWLGFSAFLIVVSLIGIIKGLNLGIDFTGGSLVQVKFEKQADLKTLNNVFDEISNEISQVASTSRKVQIADDNSVIIRVPELTEEETGTLLKKLEEKYSKFDLLKVDKVGATIGKELKTSAISALIIGAILIVIYITIRFEFIFAIAAIIALLHDVIIAIGGIALLGYEVNTPFIAAVLTILGYSINDTIVVFDRIREVYRRNKARNLGEIIDESINDVIVRSINTSLTTFLAVVAILLFGGASLQTFITTLLIGIVSGTYSSIFVASPLVYLFEKNKKIKV